MKIYQIHKYGGEWEDSFDYIVNSYLSKDKAVAEKERLELEEEERQKCNSCPLYFCEVDCDSNCEECEKHKIERTQKYCDRYKPESNSCANCDYRFYDSFFKIEEVEVIE